MRFAVFLLMLIAGPAWAEWERVAVNAEGTTAYFDPTTVLKGVGGVKVSELQDWKERSPDGGMSVQLRNEYDCSGRRYRNIALAEYSEPMGKGNTVAIDNSPDDWHEVLPRTVAQLVLDMACR